VSTARVRAGTVVASWCVAAGVLVAFGTGCSSQDRADSEQTPAARPSDSAANRTVAECSSHIDELIAARLTPAADREYAIGMCLANP